MPYELSALNEIAGEALVRDSGHWFILSEMTGWHLVRLADELEATSQLGLGAFVASDSIFQALEPLVEKIRLECNEVCPIIDVTLEDILDYCPHSIIQKWERLVTERQRPESTPPIDEDDPYTRIWFELVKLAGSFAFHRSEAEDLASQALLALRSTEAYASLRSRLSAEPLVSHALESENVRTFIDHARRFFVEVKYWQQRVARRSAWFRPNDYWSWWRFGPLDWPLELRRHGRWPRWSWWSASHQGLGFAHLSIEGGEVDEKELIDERTLPPDDEFRRLALQDLVETAFKRLEREPQLQQVIALWMRGYSSEEAAKVLGINRSKVYARRAQAFKRLKEILRELRINAEDVF